MLNNQKIQHDYSALIRFQIEPQVHKGMDQSLVTDASHAIFRPLGTENLAPVKTQCAPNTGFSKISFGEITKRIQLANKIKLTEQLAERVKNFESTKISPHSAYSPTFTTSIGLDSPQLFFGTVEPPSLLQPAVRRNSTPMGVTYVDSFSSIIGK